MTLFKVMTEKPYVIHYRANKTKNNFANDFIVSCIENLRQLKPYQKKNKLQVADDFIIIVTMLYLVYPSITKY